MWKVTKRKSKKDEKKMEAVTQKISHSFDECAFFKIR